jgi:hypothetical protein
MDADLAAVVRSLVGRAAGASREEEQDHFGALPGGARAAGEKLERGGLVAGLLRQLPPRRRDGFLLLPGDGFEGGPKPSFPGCVRGGMGPLKI